MALFVRFKGSLLEISSTYKQNWYLITKKVISSRSELQRIKYIRVLFKTATSVVKSESGTHALL